MSIANGERKMKPADSGRIALDRRSRCNHIVNWWGMTLRSILTGITFATVTPAWGGEGPFFITYSHQMEEPGNLEFGTKNVMGRPAGGNRFAGTVAEFEYGVKAWWTSEL